MSHFSVIVIGDDVEGQLAPYHEFECTGNNDQYVQDVDITDEVLANLKEDDLHVALGIYGLEDRVVSSESGIDKSDAHKYGYAIVQDGKLIKAVKRTNPNRKWDWWTIGGRWAGFFDPEHRLLSKVLKNSEVFDSMRNKAEIQALAEWDKAAAIANGQTWMSWQAVIAAHNGDVAAAREPYLTQPGYAEVNEGLDLWGYGVDDFLKPREQYGKEARDAATSPYAVVMDGRWIAKGEMGWFGMSNDDVTQADWDKRVSDLLDALPDGTPLTIVDCHI